MARLRKKEGVHGKEKKDQKPPKRNKIPSPPVSRSRQKVVKQSVSRKPQLAFPKRIATHQPSDQKEPVRDFSHKFEARAETSYPSSSWQRAQELPSGYGDNMIYLLVRDPHWIYSYWEIQKDHQEKTLAELGGSWDHVRSVLRVYDVTERRGLPSFYDIPLQGMAANWYIQAQPNRSYVVEIGLLHQDGRFLALARSNQVTTPRAGMSEILDEHWMGIDFDKIYALSGGFQVGKSSKELKELMEERLKGAMSSGSGAISSFGSPVKGKKQRGFWFVLDCELIVYGATEPDATVTLQGKPVKLRPDGTFTLRFAFPDGKQILDAHAYSADGIEERIIIPIVERKTERPAPVLKS